MNNNIAHKEQSAFRKAHIYFFSGTGNARHTASWIAEELQQAGFECIISDISTLRGEKITRPEEGTLIGFISPTHGFHFPEITRKFIRRFPTANNSFALVLNTRAGLRIGKMFIPGLSGLAHYISAIHLKRKGYSLLGLKPVDLPSNWLSLHPAVRTKGSSLMYTRQEKKVRAFAQTIIAGKRDFRAMYDIVQDALISPIAMGYLLIGRFALSKSFVASHKCTHCGLCKRSCAVQAIKEVQGRMFWTYKCESCMGCMNLCPQKAIQTAHGFFLGFFILLMPFIMHLGYQAITALFPGINMNIIDNEIIRFLLESALILPFLFWYYRIIHWLLQFRIFEKMVIWTSLTSYKFWGRYTKGLDIN